MDEEAKFLNLLQGKHHKELIGVLTKILGKLDEEPPIEGVTNLLKEIAAKPSATGVPESVKAISKIIVDKLEAIATGLKPRPNKWRFDFHTEDDGSIDHIIATGIEQ